MKVRVATVSRIFPNFLNIMARKGKCRTSETGVRIRARIVRTPELSVVMIEKNSIHSLAIVGLGVRQIRTYPHEKRKKFLSGRLPESGRNLQRISGADVRPRFPQRTQVDIVNGI